MTACSFTVRMDRELKDGASEVAESYGIDLSTVVRVIFTQMIRTNTIPLKFDYGQPNIDSMRAMQESEEMIASGTYKRYESGHDLIETALR